MSSVVGSIETVENIRKLIRAREDAALQEYCNQLLTVEQCRLAFIDAMKRMWEAPEEKRREEVGKLSIYLHQVQKAMYDSFIMAGRLDAALLSDAMFETHLFYLSKEGYGGILREVAPDGSAIWWEGDNLHVDAKFLGLAEGEGQLSIVFPRTYLESKPIFDGRTFTGGGYKPAAYAHHIPEPGEEDKTGWIPVDMPPEPPPGPISMKLGPDGKPYGLNTAEDHETFLDDSATIIPQHGNIQEDPNEHDTGRRL